ncbi:PAX3- and PAX7-binding protein 1 [Schistocerca piceifrons]|uniref:PAX3- and PAX7-binding protein 1 n=1 Tax=Schistocerca piceifrons TaxID=274613 RepID=UPI001F5FB1D8|nr:PAX3- and PAX7-binding protein 1 [Schistocerca piceifrons]XP_047099410.1 PAX3- and PAX7-binding protein 1 [Schistocerca piceifrons]
MALFKKPKKNISRRVFGTDENADESETTPAPGTSTEQEPLPPVLPVEAKPTKKKEKKQAKHNPSVLSFEEDLNEGEEVFQVKKSSQSKKLSRMLNNERKKKKEGKKQETEEKPDTTDATETVIPGDASELKIVVKQTHKPVILSGREAEMAFCDISSEEEEEEEERERERSKFPDADNVKLLLQCGKIPDAAAIHAARKRRQLARQMGEDFIPVATTESSSSKLKLSDDNDTSDEERIKMEVKTQVSEKENRLEVFTAARENPGNKEDDDEWESQQLKKGVSRGQIEAMRSETTMASMYYAQPYMPMASERFVGTEVSNMSAESGDYTASPFPPPIEPPETVVNRLRERLAHMKQQHDVDNQLLQQTCEQIEMNEKNRESCERERPDLVNRLQFYQKLHYYVLNLIECLDEKVFIISNLEQRFLEVLRGRAELLMERRRQDIRDECDEVASAARNVKRSGPEDEARTRRAAEREGRRARRRRARTPAAAAAHVDGMSSDDEVTELEAAAFKRKLATIESDADLVLDDVVEEFSSLRSIKSRFEDWRSVHPDDYREAYVSLCLPKIFDPVIRLRMLTWNPLQETTVEMEQYEWYATLLLYGLTESETEMSLREDPDAQLVPKVMERVIVPKLRALVEAAWDPLSTSQTLRLVGLLRKLLRAYPSLTEDSKPLQQLLQTALDKMKSAVANDVFIPLVPPNVSRGVYAEAWTPFFQRQFGSALKLLRNALTWHGILGERVLQEVSVTMLLNRYLLTALRACTPADAARKSASIVATFPRAWFHEEGERPPLQMFVQQVRATALRLQDEPAAAAREPLEIIANILRQFQPAPLSVVATAVAADA